MIKFRIWVDIRGVMTYATCGANWLWVWCDLTLSILKLLTVRSPT